MIIVSYDHLKMTRVHKPLIIHSYVSWHSIDSSFYWDLLKLFLPELVNQSCTSDRILSSIERIQFWRYKIKFFISIIKFDEWIAICSMIMMSRGWGWCWISWWRDQMWPHGTSWWRPSSSCWSTLRSISGGWWGGYEGHLRWYWYLCSYPFTDRYHFH